MRDLELCDVCGEPTGRAGEGDDSICCSVCLRGPLCDNCLSAIDDICPECWLCEMSND